MSDEYWTSIDGLGEKRAKILADQLGIRSMAALHASTVDEIVAALNGAGSRATSDEVETWLRDARTQLKAEATTYWDSIVRSARASQTVANTTRTVEIGPAPTLPLSSGDAFWIELEPANPTDGINELYFRPIASDREVVPLHRPNPANVADRWLILRADRGLYRMSIEASDGSVVSGPVVQVV